MLMNQHFVAAETGAVEYEEWQSNRVLIAAHRTAEPRTFELPMSIWYAMFASYAVFFGALFAVTGSDASALFAIVISVGYTVMYFGTAAVMNGVSPQTPVVDAYGDIDTFTGPMSFGAAAVQILTVPILVAFFGCGTAIIYAVVMP